jgi:hypothetical protein
VCACSPSDLNRLPMEKKKIDSPQSTTKQQQQQLLEIEIKIK